MYISKFYASTHTHIHTYTHTHTYIYIYIYTHKATSPTCNISMNTHRYTDCKLCRTMPFSCLEDKKCVA